MSGAVARGWRLEWKEAPPGWIDGAPLRPQPLAALEQADVGRLTLACGSRTYRLGELFTIEPLEPGAAPRLVVEGGERFVRLGAGMAAGVLEVVGPGGALAACGLRGGEVRVRGPVGHLAGCGMEGGLLVVAGDAGDLLGGPLPGEPAGMRGGEIVVLGRAGDRPGLALRRGLVAIAGEAGMGPGHHLRAGTVVVGQGPLRLPGAGMRRGTIVGIEAPPEPPPPFRLDGPVRPVFLRLLARRLRELGFPGSERLAAREFLSFSGDRLELGRGEILYGGG